MSSQQQQQQQQQPSTGGFKLKIKLNTQPQQQKQQQTNTVQQQPLKQQQQQQQTSIHQSNHEDDDQEDQLAVSSASLDEEDQNQYQDDEEEEDEEEDDDEDEENEENDSLSSVPPLPDPTIKISSKTKQKNNHQTSHQLPPTKKQKTQPINVSQPTIQQQQQQHPLSQQTETIQPRTNTKTKTTKQSNPSNNSKSKTNRSNMAPLTDAELLSAAGSQYPTGLNKIQSPPTTTTIPSTHPPVASKATTTKKKKPSANTSKKPPAPPINPPPIPQSNSNLTQPPINQSPQLINKPVAATRSRPKKGSKLSKTQQDPFQSASGITTPIVRPPPQPRPQHNYSLGPPPPPPVPTFKPFLVGPAPRAQAQFLPAQVLEKRTPKVRSWKKIKRQVIGISGIPFWIWTYAGDEHSDYASSKQSKIAQPAGTPSSTQEGVHVGLVPQSRPASVASSHAHPSPNRTTTGSRTKHNSANSDLHLHQSASINLGGPVLPPSFRRAPVSLLGSPLGNHSINHN